MKKAFTLAEIMIVLSVIAVLTAILLPAARNATPNEDVMKFKKAHNTFQNAILELVSSDKYFLGGDLGMRADGVQLTNNKNEYITYFCNSFADVISTKNINCKIENSEVYDMGIIDCYEERDTVAKFVANCNGKPFPTPEKLISQKKLLDQVCRNNAHNEKASLITDVDGINYIEINSYSTFGKLSSEFNKRKYASPYETPLLYDNNGFDVVYKYFCIDIDELNEGEEPFGYGMRADGKIMNGFRADEWLSKTIQEK